MSCFIHSSYSSFLVFLSWLCYEESIRARCSIYYYYQWNIVTNGYVLQRTKIVCHNFNHNCNRRIIFIIVFLFLGNSQFNWRVHTLFHQNKFLLGFWKEGVTIIDLIQPTNIGILTTPTSLYNNYILLGTLINIWIRWVKH